MAGRYMYIPCMSCLDEGKESRFPFYKISTPTINEYTVITCKHGHNYAVTFSEQRYETILHIAFEDYLNEYFRESVFNFSSAQERFFEYAMTLICMDSGSTYEQFREMWKLMANHSERQLGAFYALFSHRFRIIPFERSKFETNSKIRNSVVHKGETPTGTKAKQYGEFVIENIHRILKFLCENIDQKIFFEALRGIQTEALQKRGNPPDGSCMTTMGQSIVSLKTCSDEEIERHNRVSKFADEHPKEFFKFVMRANERQTIPDIDGNGNPMHIEQLTYKLALLKNAKFRGEKTFDEYLSEVLDLKEKYEKRELCCTPSNMYKLSKQH